MSNKCNRVKFSTNTKLRGFTKFDWILHITKRDNLLYLTFLSTHCVAGNMLNALCVIADLFLRTISGGSAYYYSGFAEKETEFREVKQISRGHKARKWRS